MSRIGYRPPATPPKGAWAKFLDDQHRQRDWNQTAGFEALADGLGLGPKSRASYLALLTGTRQPNADEQKFLVGYFGAGPSDEATPAPAGDLSAVVAAIERNTAMLEQLVNAVGRLDGSVSGGLLGLADVLGPILVALGGTLPQTEPASDAAHDPGVAAEKGRPNSRPSSQ